MYLEHHHQNEEHKKSGFIQRQQHQQQQLCCETSLLKQKELYQQLQQKQQQQQHYHQQQQRVSQQHIQHKLRSAQHKNNYKKHRKNRFNGIFQIRTTKMSDNESSSREAYEDDPLLSHSDIADTSTIGIYELSARETFGEDGACFFVVANVPQQRSRVVSSFIEDSIPQCSTALLSSVHQEPSLLTSSSLLSAPICMETFILNHTKADELRVITSNEHSVSSGVGSVASSELDSPNPSTVSSSSSSSSTSTNSCHSTTLLCIDNQDGGCSSSVTLGSTPYHEDSSLTSDGKSNSKSLESTPSPCHKDNSLTFYHKDNSYGGGCNMKVTSPSFISNNDTNDSNTNDSGCVISFDDAQPEMRIIGLDNDPLNISANCASTNNMNANNMSNRRRESGLSSMNSSSLLHCSSPFDSKHSTSSHFPIKITTSTTTTTVLGANNRPSSAIIDSDKEVLLNRVKRDLYDPTKEQQMYNLRQFLNKSGCNTFTEQITKSDWTPLLTRDNNNKGEGLVSTNKPYIKSVLKKTRMTLLEEIQARHALKNKTMEAEARREARVVCQLKRNELVKVIQQVRQCLRFTPCSSIKLLERRPYFKCQFQIHQKIKLKRFPASHQLASKSSSYWKNKDSSLENIDSSSSLKERLELADSLSCKAMKEAAGKGDIKKILNLMNSNECTHKNSNHCQTMPAFHNALQKEHFRTAILLLEAGTDLELYTEQRINEYNEMLEVVDRNRHAFNHQKHFNSFSDHV